MTLLGRPALGSFSASSCFRCKGSIYNLPVGVCSFFFCFFGCHFRMTILSTKRRPPHTSIPYQAFSRVMLDCRLNGGCQKLRRVHVFLTYSHRKQFPITHFLLIVNGIWQYGILFFNEKECNEVTENPNKRKIIINKRKLCE